MNADLHVGCDSHHVIQWQVDCRREALVQAEALDIVVNHEFVFSQ